MPIRLAAAPITWGVCELPDWGTVPPFPTVLDEMASLGFRGTELGPPGYLPQHPEALRRELQARRLDLVGAFCSLTLHDPALAPVSLESATRLAHLLGAAGCRVLVAADEGSDARRAVAGRVTPPDGLPPDAWPRIGEGLAEIATRCAPLGVRVVFHPHAGTHVETEAEVETLLRHAPPDLVGLCLDTGHLVYGGADPVALCRRHAARVWHVHAKDVRLEVLDAVRQEGTDYATAVGRGVFAPLGEGGVDFPGLLSALSDAAYDGWIVLEQDVRLGPPWPPQRPQESARTSLTRLRHLLQNDVRPSKADCTPLRAEEERS
jgi:inosose dehydratase